MSDKGNVENIENVDNDVLVKPPFRQRAKRHCARFWWAYAIAFCAIVLVVVLPVVYVAYPKIAQDDVNSSSITIVDLQFRNPTPESITMSQQAVIENHSSYSPTLDSFNASLSLVENGTVSAEPFAYIQIPEVHATGNTAISMNDSTIPITNVGGITQYAMACLAQANVTNQIAGHTNLHEGALPVINVNYNKSTTYPGMDGIKGFNITDARINISLSLDKPNFSGNAFIPNPSILTIELGNVTFNLFAGAADGPSVGNATIENMTIAPGNNSLPLTGIVDETVVLSKTNTSGFVEMFIKGSSVVYDGQHIPYYEESMKQLTLSLWMNVLQILSDSS